MSSGLPAHIRGMIVSDVVVIGFTFVLLGTASRWAAADVEAAEYIIWTRSGPIHAEWALGTMRWPTGTEEGGSRGVC